jgi:hypothetical protein
MTFLGLGYRDASPRDQRSWNRYQGQENLQCKQWQTLAWAGIPASLPNSNSNYGFPVLWLSVFSDLQHRL